MKKYFIFATALAALASCSSDDFVGESPNGVNSQVNDAINFSSGFKTITRADHVGADAADMLGEKFYVGGYKNDGTSYSTVFDHYLVQWDDNSAGTSTDNTSDWKYVGLEPLRFNIASGTQTIKYWDFAASYYDFVAFSAGKGNGIIISGDLGENKILATGIVPSTLETAAYTLQGSTTDLAECYIADLITAVKSGATAPDVNYKEEVPIKFRRLGSKVRIALYETIPGYSVRNVKFYAADGTPIKVGETDYKAPTTTPTLFASSNAFHTSGTMTVSFPTIGTSNRSKTDYNKAHVSFAAGSEDVASSKITFDDLTYETTKANWEDPRLDYTGNDNVYLKRTSAAPSFAGTDPYYKTVLPDETGNVLELRLDYTLESIDGTTETIKVHGAKAFVPQVYAAWKPNYAYTYIFKISDNTNGWTSEITTDPAGLYPITFDAIVADSQDGTQSTITTVSTPSITTYQKGHVYDDGNPDDDYDKAKGDIYVMVQDANLKDNLDTKGKLYTVSGSNITEATVMDALNIQVSATGDPLIITGRNGIVLTTTETTPVVEIDEDDSPNGNAIPVTIAQEITSDPGDSWSSMYTDYYKDEACTTPATSTWTSGTYYKKNTAVKFTPNTGIYAYVYEVSDAADSYIYSAEALTSQPSDWGTSGVWYTDPNGQTAVSTFASGTTYYKRYTNLNKVYAVKVIRVK